MPISLRISGRRQRQAGFSPLVNVGIFPSALDQDLDRNFASSRKTIVLRHCQEYIAYVLYDQMVKSFDTNAPGLLTIALTIPRGEKLTEGCSPYTLLMKVYRQFQVLYMEAQTDGFYLFKDTQADSSIFKAIVDSYSLETAPGRYVQMNTNGMIGTLAVPERQMEAFFRDTQYPEFASFKEIQIAPELISTPSLARLEIPRKERWEVFINGESTGKYIDADIPTCSVKAKDTDNYEFPDVTVNLYDVLNAVDGDLRRDGVRWAADYKSMRILGNQQGQEIMYKVVVVLPEEQRQKEYIWSYKRLDDLQILLGSIEVNEGTAISANQFNQNPITVVDRNSSAQYKISGAARLDKVNRIVKICLTLDRNYVHDSYRPSEQDSASIRDKTGVGRNPVLAASERGQKRYEELQAKYDQLNNNYKIIESDNKKLYAQKRSLNKMFKIAAAGCVLLFICGLCLLYFNQKKDSKIDELRAELNDAKERIDILNVNSNHEEQPTENVENSIKGDDSGIQSSSNGQNDNTGGVTNSVVNTGSSQATSASGEEQIKALLKAVRGGNNVKNVKAMSGYNELSDKQKQAITWLLDPDVVREDRKTRKFIGNKDYEYDVNKARKIGNTVRKKYLKGGSKEIKDLQSLDTCYNEIMDILREVTETNITDSNETE